MENDKSPLIQKINWMGFLMSQNIQRNSLNSWLGLNLTMSQLKGLIYIDCQENICVRDISRSLKMAQPNVTNLVDFLVKTELVRREENPEDRRMLTLKTTTVGKKLVTELRESIFSEMSGYLEQLSVSQLQALIGGLSPLLEMMRKHQEPDKENSGTRGTDEHR
jgi:DNA-binding MarR family transcriptional regulator